MDYGDAPADFPRRERVTFGTAVNAVLRHNPAVTGPHACSVLSQFDALLVSARNPVPDKSMKRFLPLVLLSTVIAAVFAIRPRNEDEASTLTESITGRARQKSATSEKALAEGRLDDDEPEASAETARSDTVPPELAERTNWANPYTAVAWKTSRWRFNDDSMTALPAGASTVERLCPAEFFRDWTAFTAAFLVDFDDASDKSARIGPHLLMEVFDPDSADTLRVSFETEHAAAESIMSGEAVTLREASLMKSEEPSNVGLSLTPNRVLVRVNGRLLLNVPRPSALIDRRCRFRISALPGSTVSELRIDGE